MLFDLLIEVWPLECFVDVVVGRVSCDVIDYQGTVNLTKKLYIKLSHKKESECCEENEV